MACDLGKNTAVTGVPRIRALSLNDNMATFSAHANDNSYENVFAEQLVNFVSEGDALVAISTSGNSRNVLNAVDVANALGAITIGWSGNNGGKLAKLVDMSIVVPNFCIEQIEDMHMIMEHIVTMALREAAVAERKARLGQQESVLVPLPAQPMVQNPAHPFSAA